MYQQSLQTPLENLVAKDHPYRKFSQLIDFDNLSKPLKALENTGVGRSGYPMSQAIRMLLLQYLEDLSYRELERFLSENVAAKWFCGFELEEATPDHSYFSTLNKKIGTRRLSQLFNRVRKSLKKQGLIREVFTFVDASSLISKQNLWRERDEAIAQGQSTLNNQNINKIAKDKQARYGCKGKGKYWYGYKRHNSVDMQSGLINKVALTPAKVSDDEGVKHICPDQGAVFGDKQYANPKAQRAFAKKGCHDATIKRNNAKDKNRYKDRWLSGLRSPYERVFASQSKKARYHGVAKNQFQAFMEALAFNYKRLVKLEVEQLELVPITG